MKGRMAGAALKWLTQGIGKGEMAARLSMDALGGMMAAAYTPGDLGDKLIAGTAATVGGAGGGLLLGKLGKGNPMLGTALDFAGSIGGDMLASRVGEEVMKGKSYVMGEGYASPWEKMGAEQQQILADQIRKDILTQYGIAVPGAPLQYLQDPTMAVAGGVA